MSSALARTWPSIAPYRIEDLLMDVLEGENSNAVREGVRHRLAECEKQFCDAEPDKRMKDKAVDPSSHARRIAANIAKRASSLRKGHRINGFYKDQDCNTLREFEVHDPDSGTAPRTLAGVPPADRCSFPTARRLSALRNR
jgi:hypothetical protein